MKERLFALLLAAVMVLSLGMAAVIPEDTGAGTGTQQAGQEAPGGEEVTGEAKGAPTEEEKTLTVRIVNEAGAALRLTDQAGAEYTDGSQVRPDEKGNYSLLTAALAEGFVFADSEEYTYDPVAGKLLLTDRNGDGAVTVTVLAQPVPQPEENELADGDELIANGDELTAGDELAGGDELTDGDEAAGGDELTAGAEKDEAVPVPLNEDDALPAPIAASVTVTYEDNEGGILTQDLPKTIPADGAIELTVKDEYTVTVTNGEAFREGENNDGIVYGIYPNGNVATMTITVRKLHKGAELKVTGDETALVKDRAPEGAEYLTAGDKLNAGVAFVKVRSGYKITGAEGGRFEYFGAGWDGEAGKGGIFTYYRLEAWDDPLTITVKEVDPSYWVTIKLVNPYPDQVTLSTHTAESGSNTDYLPMVPWLESLYDGSVALSAKTKAILDNYTVTITNSEVIEGDFGSGEVEPEKWFDFTLEEDAKEITVTVVRLVNATAPGTPTENNPGVPDKTAAEKKLLDEATAVAAAIRAGGTPAGVTDIGGELKKAVEDDKVITTELVVAKKSASADEEKQFKAAAGKDDTIAQYVDIEIKLKADGKDIGKITQTSAPMDFAVVLSSADLASGKIFYVIRSHDGETSILPATLSGSTLTFASDRFSVFAVVATNDIAHATVDGIADQTYTGAAVTPKPVVKANGRTLTEGTDYTLSYKNNVNAGTATVVITGKAPYTGTKEVTFRIVKPAVTAAVSPKTGDGTPIALYAAILALSAGALALTVTRRKKTSR